MTAVPASDAMSRPLMPVLLGLSAAHLLNDVIQSLLLAVYPVLKAALDLDFWQIGMITMAFQVTSSLLQPLLGYLTDRKPWPHAMVVGMCASLAGIVMMAFATSYPVVLVAAALVGLGSAVFHPEATRMARHAAAGQQGLAQGVFQIGGHAGYAMGPLLAAAVVVPHGQRSLAYASLLALAAIALMLWLVGRYVALRREQTAAKGGRGEASGPRLPMAQVLFAMGVLITILLSKNGYTAGFTSYYTFFLIERFGVSVQASQVMLFLYLVVGAAGVIIGGMVGDRIGRDRIIWLSIVGALPFALILPHANLFWTVALSILISFIMASAFSAILIYAIDLMPHRIGLVGGLFYGLSFGLGGIAAAAIGLLADKHGIVQVFAWCAWLPAFGLLAFLLPKTARR